MMNNSCLVAFGCSRCCEAQFCRVRDYERET
jgi:hypothetical protein